MAVPTTMSQWTVRPKEGLDGLQYVKDVPVMEPGDTSCLVKMEAVSLNYRDVAIPTGRYPLAFKDSVVPCSDGAGTIVAVGPKVTLHRVGDKVCTLFNQAHQAGFTNSKIRQTSLGSRLDGVLRQYALLDQTGLVPAPPSLTLAQSATLPCAALTAWNALTGIAGRKVQAGEYVLVQGSGGVSLFAAQMAQAMGATVIVTTSSDKKAARLRAMGIPHVIDRKRDENWGATARSLTADGEGVHHVLDVGGETTFAQSLRAIRPEGVISVIGFLGGTSTDPVRATEALLQTLAIVRGVNVGSKEQFVEMNGFIEREGIKPCIDGRKFGMGEAREAYDYMLQGAHWGKIVIDVI